MSRYYFIIFFLTITLSSCAQKSAPLYLQEYKTINATLPNKSEKADAYVLIAMDAYDHQEYATSSRFFEKLYDITDEKEYILEALKSAVMLKDYDRIKLLLEKAKGKLGDDPSISRYFVAYYIDKKEYAKADKILQKLITKKPNEQDYELAALIAKSKGNRQQAKRYYQKAYELKHDGHSLLLLADILLKENKSDEAIRLLESHTRMYGCSKIVCTALIKIYTKTQDLKALAEIYKKLYQTTKDPLYAKSLIELYAYQKDYRNAILFLKKTKFDDEILLEIYTAKKDYKRGYRLAQKLYHDTGDLEFLAKSAILEYEGSKNKSKKLLKDVLKKFEDSVYQINRPLFYNYYAYLLIDHDINVNKGLKLVQKALKEEPKSLFYIDTLAWGYYKKHQCQKAYKLLKPYESDQTQPEIIDHIDKIKQCIKDKTK